jgi:hypothetical protein
MAAGLIPARAGKPDFALEGRFTQGGWLRGRLPGGAVNASLDGQALDCTREGAFFAAFDRDCLATATLAAHFVDAPDMTHALSIAPRAWHIEQVDAPFHPPALPEGEFARLRAAELARIEAARSANQQADGWRQAFIGPRRGGFRAFGSQRVFRGTPGTYHGGLDMAAGAGTPYVAPADGVVTLAADQPFTLEGHLLVLDHGMGLVSLFLHASALLVKEGDRVAQGQPLGRVGMTGRATGPHLHWGLRWREARLDPLLFLPAAG